MHRHFRQSIILIAMMPVAICSAQDWASQLFTSPKHNFGTVARGAKTEHVFAFTNTTGSDIFVNSVRASCGCTTPSIVSQLVRAGEVGAIRAQFNTLSFVGQRGATITVQITKPAFTEVQLRVDGFVRKDIVFSPGEVNWGIIDEGTSLTKVVNIAYAGRPDWQITKANCSNPNIKIELAETRRQGQRVDYQMKVTVLGNATAGSIHESIVFETNDHRLRSVPLSMNGQIQSALTVSPEVLYLSDLKQGQIISKTLFVRAKKEFQCTSVHCTDPAVKTQIPGIQSKMHRLPITIDTTGKSGEFTTELVIGTDMNGLSRTVKIVGNVTN